MSGDVFNFLMVGDVARHLGSHKNPPNKRSSLLLERIRQLIEPIRNDGVINELNRLGKCLTMAELESVIQKLEAAQASPSQEELSMVYGGPHCLDKY
ncbi:hypothetical protein [Candidatus Cyanaurora vandensis]|uniref:hypothetical protein n=2 Tax=Candidatus Cyanaurora vandensis TaxID=2714958 RepID=UPI00257CC8E5|nr:hypothetical protein [Candidatus Cyanaurora vandensis]